MSNHHPRVDRVCFVPATGSSRNGGFIGWLTLLLQDGQQVKRMPVRRGPHGQPEFAWPPMRDHARRRNRIADRKAIERALLSMFGWWLQAEMKVDPGSDGHRRDLPATARWLAEDLGNGLAVPARVERHQFDNRAKESLR